MSYDCRLIMLSGGLDSTYLLKHFLKTTKAHICVHHIHLMNNGGMHDMEARACREIVAFCREKFRAFEYSESTIDRRGMRFYGFDVLTAAFEAGVAAANFAQTTGAPPQTWYLGHCKEDQENPVIRMPRRDECRAGATSAGSWPHEPPEFIKFRGPSKAEIIRYLGPELAAMCWTCRNPMPRADDPHCFVECGRCPTCRIVARARQEQ